MPHATHPSRPHPLGPAAATRARAIAQLALLAWLAGCTPQPHVHQGPLPPIVPSEFRARLAALIAAGRIADATALLRSTDPVDLAKSASARGDVRYLIIMGIGPTTPGLDPDPRPIRTWIVPATSDDLPTRDRQVYQQVAHDFARAHNQALAKLEGRVT